MDVSTPPSLDLTCPQSEADIEKYVHMFRCIGIDKYNGHEGIMIILITATYIDFCHMISYAQVTIYSQCQVWNLNFFEN